MVLTFLQLHLDNAQTEAMLERECEVTGLKNGPAIVNSYGTRTGQLSKTVFGNLQKKHL